MAIPLYKAAAVTITVHHGNHTVEGPSKWVKLFCTRCSNDFLIREATARAIPPGHGQSCPHCWKASRMPAQQLWN